MSVVVSTVALQSWTVDVSSRVHGSPAEPGLWMSVVVSTVALQSRTVDVSSRVHGSPAEPDCGCQ